MGATEATPLANQQDWRWNFTLQMVVVTALVLSRGMAYLCAGGLWRDEVHSVNMATLPADGGFFVLTNDSFPALWGIVLRSWIFAFGSSDESVRILGFGIGLANVPAMWWMARQFGVAFPWWLMTLLGLDPSMIVYGGEVRGYGLGILTFLILVGTSWQALKQPSLRRWICLTVVALLAVQSSFTNCFLLAATFIACAIVALRRGNLRVCLCFTSIGILAAISMLPYALYMFPRMSSIVKPFAEPIVWWTPLEVFVKTYFWGGIIRSVLWIVVGVIGFREILSRLQLKNPLDQSDDDSDLSLFLPLFFSIGFAGFWFYMGILRVHTALWYHIPLLALMAIATDLQMELWTKRLPNRRWQTTCFAFLSFIFIFIIDVVPRVCIRLTTLDLIAQELNESVRPNDLVVVAPWYLGVPFQRYYNGSAEWTKIPDIDGRYRPFEELLERVKIRPSRNAIETELKKIQKVLESGGRVWWIGKWYKVDLPSNAAEMVAQAPGPGPTANGNDYVHFWEFLAITHTQTLGVTMREIPPQLPRHRLNSHERPTYFRIERLKKPLSDIGQNRN